MAKIKGIYAAGMSVLNEDLTLNIQKTILHSEKILGILIDCVICLSFHLADWNSSQKAMVFWKISIRFAGFLAVIFTSKPKNHQKFMHSEKNLELF